MRACDAAALAAALILAASAAEAGPVVPFVTAIAGAFGAGGLLASGTILGFAARMALSVGLSALSRGLAERKARGATKARDLLTNYAQPVSYMETVVGRVRKGGPLGFTAFANSARRYIVIIAAHEIDAVEQQWLDKIEVLVDPEDASVTTWPILLDGQKYGYIQYHKGGAGQVVNADLNSVLMEITSAHDFAGLAYALIYAIRPPQESQAEIYTNGREWVWTGVVRGKKFYDPRTGLTAWTRNAALIIAGMMQHYGKSPDWTEVAAQADICDETVTPRVGEPIPRWTINGVFADDLTWEAAQEQLAIACDAWFYERTDGKSGFKVGAYSDPTVTLTEEDFLSVTVSEGAIGPDVPGSFSVRYTEPLDDYIEAMSAAYVVQAGSREEVECPLIAHHNQALRVAKRLGRLRLAQYSVSGTVKLIGYELIGLRFVRVTLAALDLDIVVEVDRLTRNADGMTFQIDALSVAAADWDFNAATEEPLRPTVSAVAGDDGLADAEIDLDATLTLVDFGGASYSAQIDWTWDAQPVGLRQRLWVTYSDDPFGAGARYTYQFFNLPEGELRVSINQPLTGRYLFAQVQNVASSGRSGPWFPEDPVAIQVTASLPLPPALAAFAASVVGSDGRVEWTGPNSASYLGVNIYRASASTDFADAVLVRTNYSVANVADFWTDAAPASGSWSYWARPINGIGGEGPLSGPDTVTI
jgi:hypothetical protein